MVSQKVKITNPTGLHLRPAGIFSNIANKFECRITFEYENSIANAKSVLSILGAGIKSGDEILLICEGEEEEKALKAIQNGASIVTDTQMARAGINKKALAKYGGDCLCR